MRALWRKELGEVIRSSQFLLLVLVAGVLSCATFLVAARNWERQREVVSALKTTNRQRLEIATSWSDVAIIGKIVGIAPSSGAMLLDSEAWPVFSVTFPWPPEPVADATARGGAVSPAQLVTYFFSLLAVLSSFDAVSAEKSRRTLGMLLAMVASRKRVLWVKFMSRAVVVAAGSAIALALAGAMVAVVNPDFAADDSFLPTMAALISASIMLTTLFVALGLYVSVRFPQPLTALLAGVGLWVVVLVILPPTLDAVSDWVAPPPSRSLLDAKAGSLYSATMQRLSRDQLVPMRRWMSEGPALQSWATEEMARLRRKHFADLGRRFSELVADYRRQRAVGERLRGILSGWLPERLLNTTVAAAARRDHASWRAYMDAVLIYSEEFGRVVDSMEEDVHFIVPGAADAYASSRPDLARIPEFHFQIGSGSMVRALAALVALAVWTVAVLFFAGRAFQRMDPR